MCLAETRRDSRRNRSRPLPPPAAGLSEANQVRGNDFPSHCKARIDLGPLIRRRSEIDSMKKHDGITVAGNVINHLSKRRFGDARREDRRRNVIGNSLPRRTAKSVAGSQSHRPYPCQSRFREPALVSKDSTRFVHTMKTLITIEHSSSRRAGAKALSLPVRPLPRSLHLQRFLQ